MPRGTFYTPLIHLSNLSDLLSLSIMGNCFLFLINPFLHCRWGETQSCAQSTPTNPNSPDTELRRSRIKNQGRPLVSGSAGNQYSSNFSNQTTSQSKSPLNCLNQTR